MIEEELQELRNDVQRLEEEIRQLNKRSIVNVYPSGPNDLMLVYGDGVVRRAKENDVIGRRQFHPEGRQSARS